MAKQGSKGQEQPCQKTAERRGRDGNEELGSSTGNGIDQLISKCKDEMVNVAAPGHKGGLR